jgi:hypothetical protein
MPAAAFLIDLGVLFALVALIGLRVGYTYSLGKVLQTAAFLFASISIPTPFGHFHPLGFAADALIKLDHGIMHTLGRGIEDMQAAWNAAASYTATAVEWVGREIASLSHDTAQAVEGLATFKVPKWVLNRLGAGLAAIAVLKAEVSTLEHEALHHIANVTNVFPQKVRVVYRAIAKPAISAVPKAISKLDWITPAIALPDISAVPKAIPGIKALEREVGATAEWVKANARKLTVAGIVGLTVAALGRLGLGWLRCRNVSKVGKGVCGMNPLDLAALLAGSIGIASSISVVSLAEECQTFATAVNTAMEVFVKELPSPSKQALTEAEDAIAEVFAFIT